MKIPYLRQTCDGQIECNLRPPLPRSRGRHATFDRSRSALSFSFRSTITMHNLHGRLPPVFGRNERNLEFPVQNSISNKERWRVVKLRSYARNDEDVSLPPPPRLNPRTLVLRTTNLRRVGRQLSLCAIGQTWCHPTRHKTPMITRTKQDLTSRTSASFLPVLSA